MTPSAGRAPLPPLLSSRGANGAATKKGGPLLARPETAEESYFFSSFFFVGGLPMVSVVASSFPSAPGLKPP